MPDKINAIKSLVMGYNFNYNGREIRKGRKQTVFERKAWEKLKSLIVFTIVIFHIESLYAGLQPEGLCEIPVDTACMGCDFEDSIYVTTQYWGASVEKFELRKDGSINLASEKLCGLTDINFQRTCSDSETSNPEISTPVYYCMNNINRFLDFDFYREDNSIDSNSYKLNHFGLVSYDSIYSAVPVLSSNPCSGHSDIFEEHFGNGVLRLGDEYKNHKMVSLTKRIILRPEFFDFSFDYSLILQNPNIHSQIQQPSFRVLIFNSKREDVTSDTITGVSRVDLNWGSNEIFADHPELNEYSVKGVKYKYLGWSCGKIDLSGLPIGDTLYVVFEQRDCGRGGGHWSKAFIDNIGNGLCKRIVQDQPVSFNIDSSYYVCNNAVKLCFDYQTPKLFLPGDTISGELNIYLNTVEENKIVRRDTSFVLTNPSNGQYCFDIPLDVFQDFLDGSFEFSYSSNLECYNLIPTINPLSIDLSGIRNRDIDFTLGPDAVLCFGDTKILDATTPGATYLWKGGATTSTITVDTTGIYWVTVTKDGCTKSDTIKVTFIEDPALQHIPYKTRHNCIDDDSGILQLLWGQKSGGVLTSGTDPQAVTYIDELNYNLYKDDMSNGTFDAQCSWKFRYGTLTASFSDSLFITELDTGDYQIVIQPKTICRKVIQGDSIAIDSVCMAYNQCYSDSIVFTFTVRKHIYPAPLGSDKILCPEAMVSLQVPSTYYDALPPEYIKWGTVCGIYDPTYDISLQVADSIQKDTLRTGLINGRGGVHTVEIMTQDGCIIRDTIVVADLKPLIIPDSMPSALATNAVNYSGFWSTQYNTIKWQDAEMVESFREANIYYTGVGGVFRPNKNHDYLDSLNTSIGFTGAYKDSTPGTQLRGIDIRSTGNIMPYKLFNYGNPLFVDCVPQWIHNSTMTKYSPSGFDIENKDIMGIYSSALYGYNDMLPIAVASNAKNDEIGYESFEEYSKDVDAPNYYDSLTQLNNSTGNIDLVRQTTSLLMPKTTDYEIVRAFNRYVMIKGNFSNACDDPISVKGLAQTIPTDIRTEKIEEKEFNSVKTKIMASPCGDSTYTILQLDKNTIATTFYGLKCRFWTGSISVEEEVDVPLIENIGFELDDTKAHTGKYSLKVPKNENIFLPQTDMVLKPRQTYHIGAWVHTASMNTLSPGNLKHRHATDSIGIFVKLPNNEILFIRPSGEVINGWQKIEGTFTMPAGSRTRIQLGFNASEEFNIDDIRIYPQNSAIQTYVYDPNNYKVKAVLDQNNYATIYHYDDEGYLFAIKKETVKGIKTLQVSASHLKGLSNE